jgi:DNA topoisomerase I
MSQSLIIVESPSKARTIKKYLGAGYAVKASVGHIRDLPQGDLGVDVEKGFTPKYVTIKGKEKVIKELKAAAEKADEIYLAPDPDREGEAIAWHIAQAINGKDKKIYRVLFNEITKSGIKQGLSQPREIDNNLFASQQARRILDRLVGYKISPILWTKVKRGLSAGRVQSVAMRLVVEREELIEAFIPVEYWEIFADVKADQPPPFRVRLARLNGKKAEIGNKEEADKALAVLNSEPLVVSDVKTKPVKRKTMPPFITSTMQQMASSGLKMVPKRTMRIAQQLYEGIALGGDPVGLITYMRTDAVRVSAEAVDACREHIKNTYGDKYVPEKPNFYKSRKGAQDAHEAIRPTSMENTPDVVKAFLNREQLNLYRLIWNRFVGSQMPPAIFQQTAISVGCGDYLLTVTSNVLEFPGHLAVTSTAKKGDGEDGAGLPPVKAGDTLELVKIDSTQKFTQPPNRFSESTLIREMEEKGIGRPSTYASIISVIQDKEYVEKFKSTLRPTDLGRVVTRLLIKSFPDVMDVSFTAQMEEDLDKVEDGKNDPNDLLTRFWSEFSKRLDLAGDEMEDLKKTGIPTDIVCEKCAKPMVIRFGRNGAFLACTDSKECKTSGNFERDENGKIVPVVDKTTEHKCEKCGSPMLQKKGRFGPYLACSAYPECKSTVSIDKDGNPKKKMPKAEPDPNVLCPLDEAPMILRTSRYGNRFYSCSKYPKCKGSKPFDTDISCPTEGCDGHLVEKLARKGKKKPFWSCSKYPECEFVTSEKPEKGPCPECKGPIFVHREADDAIVCPSCGYEKPVPEKEESA